MFAPKRNLYQGRTKGVILLRAFGIAGRATRSGGARRDRTDDLMLAKHALSQLSYGPFSGERPERQIRECATKPRPSSGKMVGLGRLELPTSRLSSARSNQLSYKPPSSSKAFFS